MRACWLKWVGRDWSISADYIWLNYSDANNANKIPTGQYSIRLLSDGSATYVFTNEAFDVKDPDSKQAELIALWNAAKNKEYETGEVSMSYSDYHDHWDSMYAVLSIEPGTQWWMTRTNLFTSGDDNAFANKIASDPNVKKMNVSSMLTSLQNRGEYTVQAFKALYNFNDGYFDAATQQGKKVMMLLGTYVTYEQNFDDYANLTEVIYGDDYLYYYKGHPNTPTGMYPQKQEQLDRLSITDVDSSVAAELILFFNPEIGLSGYGSSTYNSASADAAGGLWNSTKAEALKRVPLSIIRLWIGLLLRLPKTRMLQSDPFASRVTLAIS